MNAMVLILWDDFSPCCLPLNVLTLALSLAADDPFAYTNP